MRRLACTIYLSLDGPINNYPLPRGHHQSLGLPGPFDLLLDITRLLIITLGHIRMPQPMDAISRFKDTNKNAVPDSRPKNIRPHCYDPTKMMPRISAFPFGPVYLTLTRIGFFLTPPFFFHHVLFISLKAWSFCQDYEDGNKNQFL